MVVAIIVGQFFPSSRGLVRSGPEEAAAAGARVWATGGNYDDTAYRNLSIPEESSQDGDDDSQTSMPQSGKQQSNHRRKRFKAMTALTSLASDLDVVSDWLFFSEALRNDRAYRATVEEGEKPFLIPPLLMSLTLGTCILGSVLWLVLASDGRVLTPLLKRLDVEKLSLGYVLLACVVVEDIPQVVLTFLIEDYFEEHSLSSFAVCNLMASLYDTLIKLAEAYDERNDMVETGAWCKKSIKAHRDSVTMVLAVPLPPSAQQEAVKCSSRRMKRAKSTRPSLTRGTLSTQRMTKSASSMSPMHSSSRTSIGSSSGSLSSTRSSHGHRKFPRLRFLTTSADKSIRMWDTSATLPEEKHEDCVRTMRGHTKGVTCVALLGKSKAYQVIHPPTDGDIDTKDEESDLNTFFVTGCANGDAKLWNLRGECIRSFYLPSSFDSSCGITSITAIQSGATFVCGYGDGSARLWEAFSGICVASYTGHSAGNIFVSSLQDENAFISASESDSCIRLWHTDTAMKAYLVSLSPSDEEAQDDRESLIRKSKVLSETPVYAEMVCERSFMGHSGNVLCVACLAPGKAFVSGAADGTARIWGINKKRCLRILQVGQDNKPVQAIAVLDQSTILAASGAIIRMFDALSGSMLREYDGHHTGTVTSLSPTQDERVFLSSSTDKTVKVWVVTAISESTDLEDDGGLDELLDVDNITACQCGPIT